MYNPYRYSKRNSSNSDAGSKAPVSCPRKNAAPSKQRPIIGNQSSYAVLRLIVDLLEIVSGLFF